jgi:UDP-N-acetylmuramoylalanine--D-glutamate ligase
MKNVKNKDVVILGAARSGLAAAKLMQSQGAKVFVSDTAPAEKKKTEIDTLQRLRIDHEFGGHTSRILQADFVILSPGIPKTTQAVTDILRQGIAIYSELEVASWYCRAPIIAITGSNGKTTTTTLLGEMICKELPGSLVAGNIGRAYSDKVLQVTASDWAVLEVSSFQLETVDTFHPRIVLMLNLSPNHLDWYPNYDAYIDAKMQILKNLSSDDFLVYNADDRLLAEKIKDCPAQMMEFSLRDPSADAFIKNKFLYSGKQVLLSTDQIRLKGAHNYQNAMAAVLAAQLAGISDETIINILTSFQGVEHRLEYVGTIKGIDFINDSKATTIESLAVALQSFEQPLILIAGGKDKGSDYTRLNKLLIDNVKQVVLIGAAREKISKAWKDIVPLESANSLDEAVQAALNHAQSGETVLLSPACSSFDMFRDYEERGRIFKEIVTKLKEEYEHN